MDEEVKVCLQVEIPRLSEDVDIDSVRQGLNDYVKSIIWGINVADLEDWRLMIRVTLRSTNGIGVFKGAMRYPSDKEFEFSISVAIPNEKEASYGVSEKVEEAFYVPLNDKNFYVLETNFENYSNLYEYILESSKLAIHLAFTKGIRCNGKKIIFLNDVTYKR
ncbi:Imm9 family immunity protein [Capnocytophaga sp. oral taxon 338]|uniref:Imm9 family immunity protein n=1 Tax=Capnocytophaga sp. oral taxon 338 TaxID=710239 RepID=UPI000202E95B|nr:Imm9 family immunity protein [Capnocytophaga sp. oral taxon 338]EGD33114.1 hypothetical protein HMPREF9071_2307 [Capnocytophaga sp. oral taxon 338 str. F0234]